MDYFLQFCGFTDPLQLFYLEQRHREQQPWALGEGAANEPGPVYGGFRPFQLDGLLTWALDAAQGRRWDAEAIQRTVVDAWMEQAEAIRQWQLRLREEPSGRLLVAAIGSRGDWGRHCESLLRA
jgi:hypothetical protein